ncbi:hypothetical protein Leryth_020466 [Lithospermum erythrorhizon]|uniref:TIR domain-containing protein n=1 Tax=Lithospermum erythrorhizon TaxID=34254 RepID=A0AAV3R8X9_LITER|nr:hypothetical protein Leryth_020466 [Lithospermum erythrorhizon]
MEILEVDPEASPLTSAFKLRWDVFLSFRGEDTRHTFTLNLFQALDTKGVQVFKDNVLEEGDTLKEKLPEAITYSSSSVAIISKNYASSHWCLDELAMICDMGRPAFPVFYGVEPRDVRNQKGPFEEHFGTLEKEYGVEKVGRWRKAMKIVGGKIGFVCNSR